MLHVSSAAASQQSAAQEWQALAQQMGTALTLGRRKDDAGCVKMDTNAELPLLWTPVSEERPDVFADQVVIYDASEGLDFGQPRVLSSTALDNIVTHTGLTRQAANLALNLKGTSAEALQWIEEVTAAGSSIAEASATAWLDKIEKAGVPSEDAEAAMKHSADHGQLALSWVLRCRDAGHGGACAEAERLKHLPPHHTWRRIARQFSADAVAEVVAVARRFAESPSEYFRPTIARITRVQNPALLAAFSACCTSLGVPPATPDEPLGYPGQMGFHGTGQTAIQSIVREGFKPECSRQPQKLVWVASRASYSHTYSARAALEEQRVAQQPATLHRAAAYQQTAVQSCEYSTIAAATALPPVDETQPGVQRASTATFADGRALYPAYIVAYRTPESVSYY